MNEEKDADPSEPLRQLLDDLRETGKPSSDWLDAHARDGQFRDAWVATAEPLDVWRVLNYAATVERYLRLAAVSATTAAPVLRKYPTVRAASEVVAGWLAGEQIAPEALADAKGALIEASQSQTLGLDEMCAASAFISLVDMLLEHRAGTLTSERACENALMIVENAIDALALEPRESVFRDLSEAGVDQAQAQRASQLAFECADEARSAELAARLTATIECPRVDELDAGRNPEVAKPEPDSRT
jgi:hypothetical protein